jgi:hypothetical protein
MIGMADCDKQHGFCLFTTSLVTVKGQPIKVVLEGAADHSTSLTCIMMHHVCR